MRESTCRDSTGAGPEGCVVTSPGCDAAGTAAPDGADVVHPLAMIQLRVMSEMRIHRHVCINGQDHAG